MPLCGKCLEGKQHLAKVGDKELCKNCVLRDKTEKIVKKVFKDDFFDFPTPCNELVFIGTANYPEQVPDFVGDRFRKIDVLPLSYQQRLEVVRLVLRGKLKPLDNAFKKIYGKVGKKFILYLIMKNY